MKLEKLRTNNEMLIVVSPISVSIFPSLPHYSSPSFLSSTMSDNKAVDNVGAIDSGEKLSVPKEKINPLHDVPTYVQEKTEVCADINNVSALGLENYAELERKIVRKLDTWMLPQLWILYMFNYLNRTNIAQARLNTFDQDLGLQDGDYQVSRTHDVGT